MILGKKESYPLFGLDLPRDLKRSNPRSKWTPFPENEDRATGQYGGFFGVVFTEVPVLGL